MKTITISDEQHDFLKKLQHELQTQDNLCTEFPMRKPFIYVEGLYRNYEMQQLRSLIMESK